MPLCIRLLHMDICEVCGQFLDSIQLELGEHPLPEDFNKIGTTKTSKLYNQTVSLCSNCLTAHQKTKVARDILFPKNYHYRANLTKDVIYGMNDLVNSILKDFKFLDPKILDIGCNDGSLLKIFKNSIECKTIGIDPTDAILEANEKIDFPIQGFFDDITSENILNEFGKLDIITFTNVFAHIENLQGLLKSLKKLMHSQTALVVENHYLGSILNTNQFDTFYLEHPRTYSLNSFLEISKILGLFIVKVEFPGRYGGNIRVVMTGVDNGLDITTLIAEERLFFQKKFANLQNVFDEWRIASINELPNLGQFFAGKSLPARAVMLISSLNLNEKLMPVVYEQDLSPKVGNYVPGTSIEIRADSEIGSNEYQDLIIWSWHISDEIVKYMKTTNFKGNIWAPLPILRKIATL